MIITLQFIWLYSVSIANKQLLQQEGSGMYMDEYVLSGLIIVGVTCAIVGYLGYYGFRHIKEDMKKSENKDA